MHDVFVFVFFKQKTAYEIPKRDWSSDVCSSDLGELAVSGKTNQIKMPVRMEKIDKANVKTSGNTTLKMTSFGIKPPAPKLALGLIHTDDDVKITFEWLTGAAEK